MIPLDAGRPHPRDGRAVPRSARSAVARLPRQRPRQARADGAARPRGARSRSARRRCGGSSGFEARVGPARRPRDDAAARDVLAARWPRALGAARLRRALRDPPVAVDRATRPRTSCWPAGARRVRRWLRRDPALHLSATPAEIALRAYVGSSDRALRPSRGRRGRSRAARARPPRASTGSVTSAGLPVGEIARGQPRAARRGSAPELRPFARRLRLEPPAGVAEIQVDAPGDAVDPGALVGWSVGEGAVRPFGAAVAGRGDAGHPAARSPRRRPGRGRAARVAALATGAADGDRGARPRAPAGARPRALLALDQPARAAVVGSAALAGADRGRTRTRATALRVHNLLTRSTECVTSCWARVAVRRRRARRAGV